MDNLNSMLELTFLLELTFEILLPLVPAYILYKNLPGRAFVSGPFKGWNIRLSGAFAGYFALVLLVFSFHSVWHPAVKDDEWTVRGKISYEDGNPEQLVGQTRLMMRPPDVSLNRDGEFLVRFKNRPGEALPVLDIDLPECPLVDIYLAGQSPVPSAQQFRILRHPDKKEIDVADVITLRRQLPAVGPAYDATHAAEARPAKESQP
jgi:hypothetical protein